MVTEADVIAVVGLGLLGWGLWMAWPPLAPTVTGVLLIVAGVRLGRNVSGR